MKVHGPCLRAVSRSPLQWPERRGGGEWQVELREREVRMTRSSGMGRQFNEFELMPKPKEVTKENMWSEKRGQARDLGDSWIS